MIWTSKNYISCSISSTTKRVIIGNKSIFIGKMGKLKKNMFPFTMFKNMLFLAVINKDLIFVGLVISNSVIFCTALMTIWCSFDVAGRYWVRLKKYKNSKNTRSKCQISGSEFSIQPTHILASCNSENLGTSEIPPLLVHQPSSEVCMLIKLARKFQSRYNLGSDKLNFTFKSLLYSHRNSRIPDLGEIKRVVGSTGKLANITVNIKILYYF